MKIRIKIPNEKVEAFQKLPKEEKAKVKEWLSDQLVEYLKGD